MGEENVEHVYNEYYSASQKKQILPFVTTWVNPEDVIMPSEVSP